MAKKKAAEAAEAEQDVEAAVAEAQVAVNGGTPSEREKRLVMLFKKADAARKVYDETKKKASEKVQAAKAAFRTSIEAGTKNDTERVRKLREVEAAWQHQDEVKAEAIEDKKHAADHVANAERRLREAVETSAQLSLFEDKSDD